MIIFCFKCLAFLIYAKFAYLKMQIIDLDNIAFLKTRPFLLLQNFPVRPIAA